MSITNYKKAPLSEYQFTYQETTGGYTYIAYQHSSKQVIISRLKSDESELLFADGGFHISTAWTNKIILEYKPYGEL